MPQFDNRKAAQVWQRVHAAAKQPTQEESRILALIPPLHQCAAQCAGSKELSAAFRRQCQALQGICALLSGKKPSLPSPSKTPPLTGAILRGCYTQQLRALTEYQALCGHPEFGPAFQALIPLAQHNCLLLLQLLGS